MVDGGGAGADRAADAVVVRAALAATPLALGLIAAHGVVLMIGGACSYARVPIGLRCRTGCTWRAIPMTGSGISRRASSPRSSCAKGWCGVAGSSAVVADRAGARLLPRDQRAYELIEFGAALALGQGADAFLGRRAIRGTRNGTC